MAAKKKARVLVDSGAAGVPLRIGQIVVGPGAKIDALVSAGVADDSADAVAYAEKELKAETVDISSGDAA